MDILIKELKNTDYLFQIEIYDPDLHETTIVENMYFESESFAEKYGRKRWPNDKEEYCGPTFQRVVMKNGKEAPKIKDTVLYGDANYPGEIYVCPVNLEKELVDYMHEEGCCPYKCKSHWVPNDYDFCIITEENGHIKFNH